MALANTFQGGRLQEIAAMMEAPGGPGHTSRSGGTGDSAGGG